MAIKLIIWDFASVVLQPVKGGFIDLIGRTAGSTPGRPEMRPAQPAKHKLGPG